MYLDTIFDLHVTVSRYISNVSEISVIFQLHLRYITLSLYISRLSLHDSQYCQSCWVQKCANCNCKTHKEEAKYLPQASSLSSKQIFLLKNI